MKVKNIIYILFLLIIADYRNVYARSYRQDNWPIYDLDDTQENQQIKPVGGYGHPKFIPRLSNEQIELPNPYLVNSGLNNQNSNTEQSAINCEGVNCQPSNSRPMINYNHDGQKYYPLNNSPPPTTITKPPPYVDNITYDDSVKSKIDSLTEQQPNHLPFIPKKETNLQVSSYPNNFYNNHQQNLNENQNHVGQQQHQYDTICNEQFKQCPFNTLLPLVKQQEEYLEVLLNNIRQQQLKVLQAIADTRKLLQSIPTILQKRLNWPEYQYPKDTNGNIIDPAKDNLIRNRNNFQSSTYNGQTIPNQESLSYGVNMETSGYGIPIENSGGMPPVAQQHYHPDRLYSTNYRY